MSGAANGLGTLAELPATGAALEAARRRTKRVDALLQAAILALSLASVALVSTTGEWHRWGFVVGLASQPFWLIATWRARQWGMLALSIFYVGFWTQGIANRFPF